MTTNWQDIAALATVALATGYVIRLAWSKFARRSAGQCGGCSSCSESKSGTGLPVVQIGPPRT
jgi:hypothetical protein